MTVDQNKRDQLEQLRAQVRQLEAEVTTEKAIDSWPPRGFYSEYYATTGFILGMIAAAASLLVNVVGAPAAGKSPLELIRVYLTFPLGEKALQLASNNNNHYLISDGLILAMGCCLYLGTGMILGVPFFVTLSWLSEKKSVPYRFFVATVLATALWVINFYCILVWLQPLLFGGSWIANPMILPPWVALMTHLVFGWTLALLYPLGQFQGYVRQNRTEGQIVTPDHQ